MAGRDERIKRMFETNAQYMDRKDSDARLSFERKIVRKLLDNYGVDSMQRRVLESEWKDEVNDGFYLTFGWFIDKYPNFPFFPVCLHEEWKARALEIFTPSSTACKLWRNWASLKSEMSSEVVRKRQTALFIPCSQESGLGPALVMHNGTLPDGPYIGTVPNQVRVTWIEPRTQDRIHVQHFSFFAEQVALQWKVT